MDERVRTRVTFVLREVEADLAARNRNEPRESWFELMLPFLLEAEPLVPGDSAHCVLDVQNRNDLFVHVGEGIASQLVQRSDDLVDCVHDLAARLDRAADEQIHAASDHALRSAAFES